LWGIPRDKRSLTRLVGRTLTREKIAASGLWFSVSGACLNTGNSLREKKHNPAALPRVVGIAEESPDPGRGGDGGVAHKLSAIVMGDGAARLGWQPAPSGSL
jgi:hypothetical protein